MDIKKNFLSVRWIAQALLFGAAVFLNVANVQCANWAREAELKQGIGPHSLLVNALTDAPIRRSARRVKQSSSMAAALIDAPVGALQKASYQKLKEKNQSDALWVHEAYEMLYRSDERVDLLEQLIEQHICRDLAPIVIQYLTAAVKMCKAVVFRELYDANGHRIEDDPAERVAMKFPLIFLDIGPLLVPVNILRLGLYYMAKIEGSRQIIYIRQGGDPEWRYWIDEFTPGQTLVFLQTLLDYKLGMRIK